MDGFLDITINMTFTPEAAAVAQQLPKATHQPKSWLYMQAGDLIRLAGCKSIFRVLVREWLLGEPNETLNLYVDLALDAQPLSVVP